MPIKSGTDSGRIVAFLATSSITGIEGDSDSETMGVEMYQQLAVVIHQFGKKTKEILPAYWKKVHQREGSV